MLGRTIYWHCLALPKIMNGYQQIVEKSEREQRDNLAWQITNAPKLVHVAENSKIQRANWTWRSSHTPCREHVVGTWSQDMLQQQFSLCDMKKFCCRDNILSLQLVWTFVSWSRDKIFYGLVSFCKLSLLQHSHVYASIRFVCTNLHTIPETCVLCVIEGACPHFMSPLYVPTTCPLGTCANLKLLYL